MTLLDKLNSINKPALISYNHATSQMIEDFYNDFIEPRLPHVNVVKEMHKVLTEYAFSDNAIFPLRIFNENDDNRIRRGFFTSTSEGYKFFYTDNSFAYFFAKMAFDNYCPNYLELKDMMDNHTFPYKYVIRGSLKNEKKYCAFPAWKKNPGITTNYKLAHVFDAGGDTECEYYDHNAKYSIGDICTNKGIFERGIHSDWNNSGQYYERNLKIFSKDKDLALQFIRAHFLRLVDPMNYFLAPKSPYKGVIYNHFLPYDGKKENDIGEYKPLLAYVQERFATRYGSDYQEYLRLIMPPPKVDYSSQIAMPIEVEYSPSGIGTKYAKAPTKSKSKGVSTSKKKMRNIIKKVFVPSDLDIFKQKLLLSHKAEIELTYKDGTKNTIHWDASNFTLASDLQNNINSKLGHRSDKDNIVSALFKVI